MEVILYVEDMKAQVSFYHDKLGLKVKSPSNAEDFSEVFWVELESGPCTLALHAGGKRRLGDDAPKIVFNVEIRSAAPGIWVCDGVDPEGNKFSIESHE
jgi:catechol 2,3-dioxygenase-like lactoylglutathione lyase family enzyme